MENKIIERIKKFVEEVDGMSNFENLVGIFMAAFVYEKKSQGEAKKSVRDKLIRKWNQFSLEGKEIIKTKYETARPLLK